MLIFPQPPFLSLAYRFLSLQFGITATQVSTIGADGTTPTNVIVMWTPKSDTTTAPTTITVTSTIASMWAATPATLAGCALTQAGSTPTLTSAITTTSTIAADIMTITFSGAASGASQAPLVLTCSTAGELAANPSTVTAFTATAVSSADAVPRVATYNSVTAMTAIDGDVDITTVSLTPTKIVLKATPTTAIGSSGTITFTAGGTHSAIWVSAQTPTCTGTKAGSAISTAITSSTTSTSSITITIAAGESIATGEALVFECTGSLAANAATGSVATTFTATSSGDAQQVAFSSGYVTPVTLTWTQGTGGGTAWSARSLHAAVCFDDGVVVTTGGYTAFGESSEVHTTTAGGTALALVAQTTFTARQSHAIARVMGNADAFLVVGGAWRRV